MSKKSILNIFFGGYHVLEIIPGLALAVVVTIAGMQLTGLIATLLDLTKSPVSAIMMAIVLGILVKNTIGVPKRCQPGVDFGLKKLLRFGIILMGIRLSIFAVLKIGILSTGIVVVAIATGIVVTLLITRKLRLAERLGTLIGVGTGICGASAIVATGSAIEAKTEEITYAVATITIFGTVTMFIYPYVSHLILSMSHIESGIFMGTSIHETAQVAGAGLMYDQLWIGANKTVNPTGADVAIVTKLVRNAFMAIAIPLLSYLYLRRSRGISAKKVSPLSLFPTFILGFVALAVIRSLGDYLVLSGSFWNAGGWNHLCSIVKEWSGYFLAVAMAGVGLGTDIGGLKQLGAKPFFAGLFAALSVGVVSTIMIKVLGVFLVTMK
jgi:uncharacterized integral membrane protein (TIGR00698 family)